jgi:hypothetical protein
MARQEIAVEHPVHIPRRGSRGERDTLLDIRFAQVTLQPPQGYTIPITVWAVYAVEQSRCVSARAEPIEWLLLTTLEVKKSEEALQIVNWYTKRWGIEVYHRTLKSGCRIENRQLGETDRLEVCLGIDMVVAWRIYYLTMQGREHPDLSCTAFFQNGEWQALYCLRHATTSLPAKPPTIREAVFMVARLGGHLGRKCDGFPGTETIWRGLVKLIGAAEMYAIFTHIVFQHPLYSGP